MNPTDLKRGCVKVIHGANDGTFALEGAKVGSVRSSLVDAFNIPKDAIAFVNGEQVDMGYTLATDDTLEFCKQSGSKGIRRMFTKAEILREYTGYPADVMDELFASLAHDDVNGDGQPIWHEIVVDEWLDERYSRKQVDDGRDKVIPPSSVRIAGHIVEDITTTEWKILDSVLSKSTADRPGVSFDEVIEDAYGHDAGWKDEALKQQIKTINKKFSIQGSRASVHIKNRFVTISK
jgi:hypothetical protein